jgi:hypothetical protein
MGKHERRQKGGPNVKHEPGAFLSAGVPFSLHTHEGK